MSDELNLVKDEDEVTDEQIDEFLGVNETDPADPEGFDKKAYRKAMLDEIERTAAGIREQMKVCLWSGDHATAKMLREQAKKLFKKREYLLQNR